MVELDKKDIPVLDGLLKILVETNSPINGANLRDFEIYKDSKDMFLRSEFSRLAYFFDLFGCGKTKDDGGVSQWTSGTRSSAAFRHSGGFKNAYNNLEKANEDKELEKELKLLQKENFEYSKTIRDQESRIRNLTEKLRFMSLIKQYWWVITTCLGIGWLLGEILDKI